jgi:hypothetical protein
MSATSARHVTIARRVAGALLVAATAVLVAAPSPASAAFGTTPPTFGAPVTLSATDSNSFYPQVAVAANGDAVAVWEHFVGNGLVIEAATRPAGGAWSAPAVLSATTAFDADVAVSPAGDAVAVWTRLTASGDEIAEAATRPVGGTWSAPTPLSTAPGHVDRPHVGVSVNGSAVAVWTHRFAGTETVEASTRSGAGGAWSSPKALSGHGVDTFGATVGVAGNGDAAAIWSRWTGEDWVIEAATRPAGQARWSPPATLSGLLGAAALPHVALTPRGDAVAIWDRQTAGNGFVVESATRAAGHTWSAATVLSDPGGRSRLPQVGVSAGGEAVAIWQRLNADGYGIEAASRPAGRQRWSAPVPLTSVPGTTDVRLAVSAHGDAVAIWERGGPAGFVIQEAARPTGGAWSAPTTLNAPQPEAAEGTDVAISSHGQAVAVWKQRLSEDVRVIEAAATD